MSTPQGPASDDARWAAARRVTSELAEEAGVTETDREWAATVLGVGIDN